MSGTFTKNLLVKDKKGRLLLIVAHEDQPVKLKILLTRIGASRSLRFASADQMRDVLGIAPCGRKAIVTALDGPDCPDAAQ